MLTRALAIADYDRGRIHPDRLHRRTHAQYAGYAQRMLEVYRRGLGRTRRDLHRDIHAIFADETACPIRRVDAFCKLLDDVSTFEQGSPGEAAALRSKVFRLAAPLHPLVASADRLFEHSEAEAKAALASQLGFTWAELDQGLFSDVMECHRLAAFEGFSSAQALLARYNVAQVQVALFAALDMTVWATDDFKTILRYAKLARLMHTIRRQGASQYVIRFDGPASILRGTRRYGVAMARFLPALLACRGWRLHATLETPRRGRQVGLDLSPADQLTSHLPPPEEFDSQVEEAFARRWGGSREGWSLHREGEVLHRGQKVFVPDFVLRHDDGRLVLLEIVGFWTPEYLQAKFETLRLFQDQRVLLAIAKSASRQKVDLPPGAIGFTKALRVSDVVERLATEE
jgi:predicted nuclease of restriction endonuclease-like RecB superfamily